MWSRGVSQPDPDRGDVDGALVDVFAFVVAGGYGAGAAQLVDRPLDDVALLVGLGVEGRGPPAPAAFGGPVRELVTGLGDGGLDASLARIGRGSWSRSTPCRPAPGRDDDADDPPRGGRCAPGPVPPRTPASRAAAPAWSAWPPVGSGCRRPRGSWCSARHGSGRALPYRAVLSPASADSCHSARPPVWPAAEAATRSNTDTNAPVGTSAGGSWRAPAACW